MPLGHSLGKVVALARELKLEQHLRPEAWVNIPTVAEGIETPGELRWVRTHGVDYVQGYLIARPQSPPARTTPYFTV